MSEEHVTSDGIVYRREGGIVRATITPDPRTAESDLLSVVADLEGVSIEALPSLYTEADHFVELLFGDPPSDRAQMQIAFSYAGYRITMDRSGEVEIVEVKASATEL